jgi:hypothetical protein
MISAGKVGDFAISGQPIAAARSLCSDSTGCADVCPDVSRYLVSPYRFMVELSCRRSRCCAPNHDRRRKALASSLPNLLHDVRLRLPRAGDE